MNIVVTDEAFNWFKKEMEVEPGDFIRFYARYGGSSPFHEGFSLGMNRETPHDIGVESIVNGVHFYIEKDDEWFFNQHDLHVVVNKKIDEIAYEYKIAE
ncbi:HesB/YadR/YfhF family protein [Ureibacillus sp. MALMAid1270]|uniref:HesB/YadR/YfhF family protein n=1 Tax=Ureibacillus sp. MALMAid1270 TaxID=3411629 RepID=UPI003BA58B26